MDRGLSYSVFETTRGWVGCVASERGLLRVALPHPTAEGVRMELGVQGPGARDLKEVAATLKRYFNGERVDFDFPLDYGRHTPFQVAVWEATRTIPYGETRTYGWVARETGRPAAFRAAGQALGRNPLPIIVPCHRVIASDGGLQGFGRGVEGLDVKRMLLRLEGALE